MNDAHVCADCGTPVTRKSNRGKWPARCAKCKAAHATTAGTSTRTNGHEPSSGDDALDALDIIDAFRLDFNVGNAVRFLLEKDDGDERANLETAKLYLDRAIARLEA